MLISKGKISKGDIATFKLINGEELAGAVTEVTNDYYVIEKPTVCQLMQQGVAPFPALLVADSDVSIELYKKNIMYSAVVSTQFKNVYIKSTTSIEMPPAGLKVN